MSKVAKEKIRRNEVEEEVSLELMKEGERRIVSAVKIVYSS